MLFFAVEFLLALWVYRDAKSRGLDGFVWGLLVFFTSVVGLLVYMLVNQTGANGHQSPSNPFARPAAPQPPPPPPPPHAQDSADKTECVACGESISVEFKVCPFCGQPKDERRCGGCGASVEPGWRVCPHCATRLETGSEG